MWIDVWFKVIPMLYSRYAERTNKGEVVAKHGVEDGWEAAGCRTTVRLPPGTYHDAKLRVSPIC